MSDRFELFFGECFIDSFYPAPKTAYRPRREKKGTQIIVFYLPVLVSPVLSVYVSILAVMKLVSQIGPIHTDILFSRIFELPLIRVHFEVD